MSGELVTTEWLSKELDVPLELIEDIKTWPGGIQEYVSDLRRRVSAFETSNKGADQ